MLDSSAPAAFMSCDKERSYRITGDSRWDGFLTAPDDVVDLPAGEAGLYGEAIPADRNFTDQRGHDRRSSDTSAAYPVGPIAHHTTRIR